ncbi:Nif3-like dinuclear metal center hexameric protein [Marinirhabdus gelatinilytica]|uniref:GTP cyclohydrolase 1 type 2 homolog n=1 Tax=Marinirhabdus gelatinilytica TaxID=1703343 RepID=A0A370Q9F1_9FLAO|nr:Nif3-like dinuclear metal center hexameric protein [Marinirhabdus gelatinilytica]RDK84670.1 dinuclear metal center YbgI/SA1388 family protein [Marinirhabdus gelatinilytica]
MIVQDVITILNEYAPLPYAEDFDNTGLLVGDTSSVLTGVLVTLDTLETVVDEAIENNCNLIVSFHPIIFSGLKKLTGKTYVERTVQKAIKNDISIFAIHTALDNSWNGVNAKMCDVLGLKNRNILLPKTQVIQKLTTFVPSGSVDKVRNALFKTGAGNIGNYSHCSFSIEGKGSFKGEEGSEPTLGQKGELRFEVETQIGITFSKHLRSKVLKALFAAHPYEEVAHEITTLENTNQHLGMGMLGELEEEVPEKDFLALVKSTFKTGCVRHSGLNSKMIKRVAVLGGSGSFAIKAAKAQGADAFVSSDFKYHDFFQAEDKILLCDVGHYESEQYTKELLVDVLTKKITNFAVVLSQTNTNPISYF